MFGQRYEVTHLTTKDGLPQRTIRSIVKDKYGFLWVATWNGLCRYDGHTFKVYQTVPGDSTSIANSRIHYIYKDPEGILWISTFNSFVCRYNYETDDFTRFKIPDLPQAIQDSTNRLNNVSKIEGKRAALSRHIGPFDYSENSEHVVFRWPSDPQPELTDNHVNSVYYDDQQLLWLGTTKGGINKVNLRPRQFDHRVIFNTQEPGQRNAIRALWTDTVGIWVGTQEDGLYFVDREKKQPKKIVKHFASQSIRALLQDSRGHLWVGSQAGLDRYDPRSDQLEHFYGREEEQVGTRFYAIAEDPKDGSVWFGTQEAILRYDVKTREFEPIDLTGYFTRSSAGCLYFDEQHDLWIGTEYSGLIHMRRDEQGRWRDTVAYTGDGPNALLPDERVYSVAQDNLGMMWIATANGLCRLNPKNKQIIWFGKKEGLADVFITKVLFDGGSQVWMGHKRGVSRITTTDFTIQNYTIPEGREDYESIEGAGCVDKLTGELLLGGMGGYVSFSPIAIAEKTYTSPLVLTNLIIQNREIQVGEEVDGDIILSRSLHITDEIVLNQNHNSFSITFASLDYVHPQNILYAYQLEGVDEDWVYTDATSRVAMYRYLPAGKYSFSVKASNNTGGWSEESKTLVIHILPPWWQTWWAYLLYGLFGIVVLYIVISYLRTQARYRQKILAERLKVEKTRELETLKTNFFTQVSHELRTPLTLLIDPLRALLTGEVASSKHQHYYQLMYRNANRLLVLVNQLLDFRKIESVPLQLQATHKDIVEVVKTSVASFAFQAKQKDIQIDVVSDEASLLFMFDLDALEKIIFNLMSNALKFTPDGGKIAVRLRFESAEQVTLAVANSGSFIAKENLEKIFNPFFQIAQEQPQPVGSGIGLSVVKELALQHGGDVQVESPEAGMTVFTVVLRALAGAAGKETWKVPQEDVIGSDLAAGEDLETVLIVEDDKEVRSYLSMMLADKNYRVEEAETGREGWAKATDIIPDLIISDVMMSEYNGMELCDKLKPDSEKNKLN